MRKKLFIIFTLVFAILLIPNIVSAAELPLETPKLVCDPDNIGTNYVLFSGHCDKVPYDYMVAEISTSPNYSNPRVIKNKFSYDASNNLHYDVRNLAKNRKYYIRVKVVRGNESSGYGYLNIHTPKDVRYSHPAVRPLISKMKKNRKFTYRMKGCYNEIDVRSKFLSPLYEDYPQYSGRYDVQFKTTENYTDLKFIPNKKDIKKCKKLTKVIDSIARGANKKKGTKAKVKYINDRMCKICSYTSGARGHDDYTAYGCLVKHRAVCMGYAHAFRAIAVQCKIPVTYEGSSKINHVWNKVKIGGKWRHVDVTWNDGAKTSRYLLTKSHEH